MRMASTGLLEGRTALITGAGNGIGREVALRMAAEGARVVVNDLGTAISGEGHDPGPAMRVVQEIRDAGGEAVAHTGSVTEWSAAQEMVQCALDSFGRLDIVVNNAGNVRFSPFDEMPLADWESVLHVHLFGSFHVARAAAPHFRAQRSGNYVHMSSAAGLIGNRGTGHYAAAKLGIVALSRAIAFDMGADGVRSNCIAPSAVSRMTDSVDLARRDVFKGTSPAAPLRQRQGRPEQVVPLVLFLASDLSKGVTGQVFGIRGKEVYLYNQPRPIRALHRDDGWTPERFAEHMVPAWRSAFMPLETYQEVFSWDPLR
jgi:NAD(P)-dependent dehydrogenase (short-subunit alcohol dehydrogenase family)